MPRPTLGLIALLAFALAPLPALPAWPDKPIRLIVNVGAGGAPDVVARLYAPRLSEALGQPVIVENRAGAGGSIGLEAVARAAPDGYTLLSSASSSFVIGPHVYKLGFDPVKDVTPVAPTALTPMYLVVRPSLAAKSVAELLAHARAIPGKLNYGSAGAGTLPHIATEMLLRSAGIQATHVPFKGSGPALAALIGEQIDFVFDPGVAIPHVKAGKARLLAVGSAMRSQRFPDTPTLREAGADMTAVSVVGVYAPAGTPLDVITRLNREITGIMQTHEARTALSAMAAEPIAASPQEFAALLARDRERFGIIVRDANIQID
ncbi:MAG: Bug family tripartite tricarboxylate transporter substrate binding protein [Burkholderiales bacterium]